MADFLNDIMTGRGYGAQEDGTGKYRGTVANMGPKDTENLVLAIMRRYKIPRDAAGRVLNYLPQDATFNTKNFDDETEWHDKEFARAIDQLSQEDGIDYWKGETLANKSELDAQAKTEADKVAANEKNLGDVYSRLDAFAKEMNMPIDELLRSDEYAKATRNMAFNQSQTPTGFSGGMSNMNSDRATKDALINYQMQRKQIAGNTLGQLGGMAQAAVGRDDDWKRYNNQMDLRLQGLNAQASQQAFQEQQGPGQMIGGLLGGVAGALIPGVGAGAGSQFGAGLGGGIATGFRQAPTARFSDPRMGGYRAPRAYGGSGGLSGGGNR